MACATTAIERGHDVTLFDAADRIGGQFNIARQIPGKEDFNETLRYFGKRIETTGVKLRLNTRAEADALKAEGSTMSCWPPESARANQRSLGSNPTRWRPISTSSGAARWRKIGGDHQRRRHRLRRRRRVPDAFPRRHAVKPSASTANGASTRPTPAAAASNRRSTKAPRRCYLLQRKGVEGRRRAGQDHRWIRRTLLKKRGVTMIPGVSYRRIDEAGLHISVGGGAKTLPNRHHRRLRRTGIAPRVAGPLEAAGIPVTLIGGADVAAELDAKRAIDQGAHRRPVSRDAMPRRKADTRLEPTAAQNLRAAAKLFVEKGFDATTTRDIAEAVGMRSGSPFYHFRSKRGC